MFLPECMSKHQAEMETHDAKKRAAPVGLTEVFGIAMLVASSRWLAALGRHTFRSVSPLFCKISSKKCSYTEMANTVNL